MHDCSAILKRQLFLLCLFQFIVDRSPHHMSILSHHTFFKKKERVDDKHFFCNTMCLYDTSAWLDNLIYFFIGSHVGTKKLIIQLYYGSTFFPQLFQIRVRQSLRHRHFFSLFLL